MVHRVCYPATGRPPDVTPEFRDEAEARKKITALLLAAPTFVFLDNLSHAPDSASLAAVLTCETWTERLPGSSRTVRLPVTCCWLANGDNPRLSKALVRRT